MKKYFVYTKGCYRCEIIYANSYSQAVHFGKKICKDNKEKYWKTISASQHNQ